MRTDDHDEERDARVQAFAAELTRAAYAVALRHGSAATWVDLELDIWRALIQTVRKWDGDACRCRIPPDQPAYLCDSPLDFDDHARLAAGG